jgi:hypothetical protein
MGMLAAHEPFDGNIIPIKATRNPDSFVCECVKPAISRPCGESRACPGGGLQVGRVHLRSQHLHSKFQEFVV